MATNNKKPIKKRKRKRGKKRNASNLLSTNNQNNNTQNPRATKRQRIATPKLDTTVQTLLQMSVSEINALPQPLQKQALALRQKRNINSTNITPEIRNLSISNSNSNSESESDKDSEDDYSGTEYAPRAINPNTNTQTHIPKTPMPYTQQTQNTTRNDTRQRNANKQSQFVQQRPKPNQSIYSVPIPRTTHNQTLHRNIPKTQTSLHYNQNNNAQPTYNANNNSEINDIARYISAQDLVINEPKRSECNFCKPFFGVICMVLLCVLATKWSDNGGIRYCDTNKTVISAFNSTKECIECPFNRSFGYCMAGKVWCDNATKGFVFDAQRKECVQMSFVTRLGNVYTNVWNGMCALCESVWIWSIDYYNNEIIKWKSVREWKKWFEELRTFSNKELCKQFEMEIMVSFFALTYYLPMLRLLIIFVWTRMILYACNDSSESSKNDDEFVIICLKLLSYYVPCMIGYAVWNRVAVSFGG